MEETTKNETLVWAYHPYFSSYSTYMTSKHLVQANSWFKETAYRFISKKEYTCFPVTTTVAQIDFIMSFFFTFRDVCNADMFLLSQAKLWLSCPLINYAKKRFSRKDVR